MRAHRAPRNHGFRNHGCPSWAVPAVRADRCTYRGGMVDIEQPKKKAAGVPAVLSSFKFGLREMGPARTAKVFQKMNQDGGFDCPSCAWPDPDHKRKHAAEFCENGAKAVAWEATRKRVPRAFFAENSVEQMDAISEFDLGKLGRITEPMLLRA